MRCAVGFAATAVSLLFLFKEGGQHPLLLASAFLAVICVTDTLWSRIPNWATVTLLAGALGFHSTVDGVPGLLHGTLGAGTGLGLLLIPYLMGGMGGGDVKALGALGALIGAGAAFQVFLYMALAGGALSVLHLILSGQVSNRLVAWRNALLVCAGTRSVRLLQPVSVEELRFPYAAAIAFGFYAHHLWGAPW